MKTSAVFQPVGDMLKCGNCEPLKAGVHGAVLTLAALCAAYNIAAWLKRREPHLAVNACLYATTVFWERFQVAHHLTECHRLAECPSPELSDAA